MANLVIVESPFKATAINHYLGSNYKVIASAGHIRDLPKSTLGVDIENGFEAHYINIRGKGDIIKELRTAAKKASNIYLATDADREGEAISWHLATVLGIPEEKTKRITFNEVTKQAVTEAIKHPRPIDTMLVESQQARRILDRIVGYKLSPYLWKTVRGGLSAGRVQSVATRIIVEREAKIEAFVPTEYWTITAYHAKEAEDGSVSSFTSSFYGTKGGKIELTDAAKTSEIVEALDINNFKVTLVKLGSKKRHPAPPFTTFTLQQDGFRKLGYQTSKIMSIAQGLYEGIDIGDENGGVTGLITYMRTDSQRVSEEAQNIAKEYIKTHYGEEYYPEETRVYKSDSDAQDAHEAIRPSNPALEPSRIKKHLSNEQYKLYKLIWDRFIASQMADADISTVNVELENNGYIFHSNGQTLKFKGFLSVYEEPSDTKDEAFARLPQLCEGETVNTEKIDPEQHFTEPPARFNEATFVRFLKEKGIGRPSTTATIISTIISRGYVKRDGKSLVPTDLGKITTSLMIEHFPDIVDYTFTAEMESDLDSVASGENTFKGVLSEFYDKFSVDLEKALKDAEENTIDVPDELTDIICDKCGATMIIKSGRYGKFAACPNYPECKNTKPIDAQGKEKEKTLTSEETDRVCDKCGKPMVIRQGKYGKFYACSAFPACKNTIPVESPSETLCPLCSAPIIKRFSKKRQIFYGCSNYPDCTYVSWYRPSLIKCQSCNMPLCYKKADDTTPVCCNKNCPLFGQNLDAESDES